MANAKKANARAKKIRRERNRIRRNGAQEAQLPTYWQRKEQRDHEALRQTLGVGRHKWPRWARQHD